MKAVCIAIIVLTICYTANAAFVYDMQKQLNVIRQDLRRYFEQIDYINLDLLLKKQKNSTDKPPNDLK